MDILSTTFFKNLLFFSNDIKRLHLDLSPTLWVEFGSQCKKISDFVGHNVEGKSKNLQYVGVPTFSQILIIVIVHSIQFRGARRWPLKYSEDKRFFCPNSVKFCRIFKIFFSWKLEKILISQNLVKPCLHVFISTGAPAVFYLELKNVKIFKIEPKLTFLHNVFSWNYLFGGRISNFLPGMWEVFQVHLDLSLTMWAEFQPHCGSQCGRNVKSLWA